MIRLCNSKLSMIIIKQRRNYIYNLYFNFSNIVIKQNSKKQIIRITTKIQQSMQFFNISLFSKTKINK